MCQMISCQKTPILELSHVMRVGIIAIELLSPEVNKTGEIHIKTGSGYSEAHFGGGFVISNVKTRNRPEWDPKRKLLFHQALLVSHDHQSKNSNIRVETFCDSSYECHFAFVTRSK